MSSRSMNQLGEEFGKKLRSLASNSSSSASGRMDSINKVVSEYIEEFQKAASDSRHSRGRSRH